MVIETQGVFALAYQCPLLPNFYLSSTISNQVSIRAMLKLLPELGLPMGCLPSGTSYNHLSTVLDFIIPFETRRHTVGARLF